MELRIDGTEAGAQAVHRARLGRRALLAGGGSAVAALAACGPVAARLPGARQQPARTFQPASLSFWIWDKPQQDTVQQRSDLTTKRYPHIKVTVEVIPDYWTKLQTAIAGGTPPDIMWTDPAGFMTWAWRGWFLDLQPYVDADAEFRETIGGCFRTNVTNYLYRCRLHGVPRNAACVAIAYNEELVAREGLRPPAEIQDTWTWDTLADYARALTRREGGRVVQWGFYGGGTGIHAYGPFLYSNGGQVIDQQQTWRCMLGSAAAVQAFDYLRDMVLTRQVQPLPDVLAELGGGEPAFFAGKVALMPLGSWRMKTLNAVPGLRYNVARVLQARGAKLAAHHTVAEALAAGDERTIHYAFGRADYPTCRIDVSLGQHDVIRVGSWTFEAINIPGHSEGSMAYLTECDGRKVMFVGDFVFHERPPTVEGSLAWNGGTEFNTDKFLDSLLRMQRIRVDALLPGHGGFLLAHGSTIVDHALVVALRAWGNKHAEKHRA